MTPVRILVTGAHGYVGQHVCWTLCEDLSVELHGTYRTKRLAVDKRCQLHQLDLTNAAAIAKLIAKLQPDQIYHLAGNIHAGRATGKEARASWNDNLQGTLNLCDACVEAKLRPRIVLASTGAIYGESTDGQAITESTELRPLNAYAASKAAADLAGHQYWKTHGLPVVRARLFNYLGAGQDESTALSRFAYQLARLERSNFSPAILNVGNLDAERDFIDIADLVRALMLLMERGEPGEGYNIASGVSHPMRWYLDELIKQVRIPIEVRTDPTLIRTAEAQRLQVDISKLQALTGWKPTVPLHQTLTAMMITCREVVAIQGQSG
ncbi:MAG TPA: GDP-mannose 4,6-dehydratase [Gemmatales bacterium]|nr:GDP-mannose 4,6-dehydratase [Gemmatales bacterium]